jgi:signal transduction histidine kinase
MTRKNIAQPEQRVARHRHPHSNEIREENKRERLRLSFLSHDLNNNLSVVTLHLALLEERLAAAPGFVEDLSFLRSAREAIERTTEGMSRLLTHEHLRRQDPPSLKVEGVDLCQLADDVLAPFRPQAAAKGVGLSSDVVAGTVVYSDRSLIALVLQNLIGNAVKFSDRGTVRVKGLFAPESRRRDCVLSVSDQGPGISPNHEIQIFEAFRRGDCHGCPGVGLGLAIACEAARLLRSDLSMSSQVGVGSTFRLTLRSLLLRGNRRPRPVRPYTGGDASGGAI